MDYAKKCDYTLFLSWRHEVEWHIPAAFKSLVRGDEKSNCFLFRNIHKRRRYYYACAFTCGTLKMIHDLKVHAATTYDRVTVKIAGQLKH